MYLTAWGASKGPPCDLTYMGASTAAPNPPTFGSAAAKPWPSSVLL